MEHGIKNFSVIAWQEDAWFIARCLEVEVTSQGKSKEEALSNLKEALELYFEDKKIARVSPIKNPTIETIHVSYA